MFTKLEAKSNTMPPLLEPAAQDTAAVLITVTSLSVVSCKLPSFWVENPEVLFLQAEA
jgi:hypothetical protein